MQLTMKIENLEKGNSVDILESMTSSLNEKSIVLGVVRQRVYM